MTFYVGDRVSFFAAWSTWRGERGTVTAVGPNLWVRIDGDTYPVAVDTSEVVRDEQQDHVGGAE